MSISHFFEQNCRHSKVSIGLKFVMPRKNEASKAICMQGATLISKEKERKTKQKEKKRERKEQNKKENEPKRKENEPKRKKEKNVKEKSKMVKVKEKKAAAYKRIFKATRDQRCGLIRFHDSTDKTSATRSTIQLKNRKKERKKDAVILF